jgi:molybdate transport system substrate-binding protein
MKRKLLAWGLFVIVTTGGTPVFAGQALVAVAANFIPPFREIAIDFEAATGHTLQVVADSSEKLYSQIKDGAPFDLFFSADTERPRLLEEEGLGVKGTRFTYAIGRLVLWSSDPDRVKGEKTLRSNHFEHLAIVNPKTAPYGVAAMQTMQKLQLWDRLQPRIVMGENLGKTRGLIESGKAELGFLTLAQVMAPTKPERAPGAQVVTPQDKGQGSRWDVPNYLHEPLMQDVILLAKGKDNAAAKALMEFMSNLDTKVVIERYGYEVPL